MKTLRFPLYARILIWFFLNLLILAGLVWFIVRAQFLSGPESLLTGAANERLRALGEIIAEELNASAPDAWTSTLSRFSKAYRVQISLFRNDGTQLAGPAQTLPGLVRQRLEERGIRRDLPPRRFEGPDPMGEVDPLLGLAGERPADRPFRPEFERPRDMGGDGPMRDGPRPLRPIFAVRVDHANPSYWFGIPIRLMERPEAPRRGPATVLLASASFSAGGLIMDLRLLGIVAAVAVVFSVLFWIPLVRSITRSVRQLESATAEIAAGNFGVRVDEARRDELGLLGAAVNTMANRLSGFVTGQKRFLGDIAHELCSPLARMQMALGILDQRAGDKEKPYVEDVREEVQQMSSLVNELLSFSRASLGANAKLQACPLQPLIERAVKRESANGADIRMELPPDLQVIVDPELIVRAVSNLLRNAIRYAGHAGPIMVSAAGVASDEVELIVADSGPGVPETELPKLFDPFYRVDTSRARETGGVGLGLSIVKTCVESCQGTVQCRNRSPSGLEVVVHLPRA